MQFLHNVHSCMFKLQAKILYLSNKVYAVFCLDVFPHIHIFSCDQTASQLIMIMSV